MTSEPWKKNSCFCGTFFIIKRTWAFNNNINPLERTLRRQSNQWKTVRANSAGQEHVAVAWDFKLLNLLHGATPCTVQRPFTQPDGLNPSAADLQASAAASITCMTFRALTLGEMAKLSALQVTIHDLHNHLRRSFEWEVERRVSCGHCRDEFEFWLRYLEPGDGSLDTQAQWSNTHWVFVVLEFGERCSATKNQ